MRYIKAWAVCEKVKAIKVKASFQENEVVRFGEWPSQKYWYLIDFRCTTNVTRVYKKISECPGDLYLTNPEGKRVEIDSC